MKLSVIIKFILGSLLIWILFYDHLPFIQLYGLIFAAQDRVVAHSACLGKHGLQALRLYGNCGFLLRAWS